MPSTNSPEELLSLGKAQYRSQSYNDALEALILGLNQSHSASLTLSLLDARAATYEKLSNLKSALKDGRQMIRTVKSDARGYLRTGRVLQAMEKDETALDVYKMGLRNVCVKDKEFELLQKIHNRVTLKLSPAKSIDPWTVLPVELVHVVISYLGFRQMVKCLRVSKGWNRFLKSVPGLWQDLDLRFAKSAVSKKFVRSAIITSQKKITRASLYRFADKDMLQALARTCKDLYSLEFVDSAFTGASVIDAVMLAKNLRTLNLGRHCEISTNTVTHILRHACMLRELVVEDFLEGSHQPFWDYDLPHLTTFVLKCFKTILAPRMNFGSFIQRAKNLKVLELTGFREPHETAVLYVPVSLKSLPLLERLVVYPSLEIFMDAPSSLRHLEGGFEKGPRAPGFDEVLVTSPLLSVEELHVTYDSMGNCSMAMDDITKPVSIDHSSTLTGACAIRKLSFSSTITWEGPLRSKPFENWLLSNSLLRTIEQFSFINANISDSVVDVMPEAFPRLTHLSFVRCDFISGVSVKSLILGYQKRAGKGTIPLQTLHLEDCPKVSADAIEWARIKGLSVVHKTSPTPTFSKRIR